MSNFSAFIEAFACGLPIVSYKTGGIPYIVENGKTGILVAQKDFKALAEKALELFKNENAAQEIIENARAEVKRYKTEKVREDWREFFQSENPH